MKSTFNEMGQIWLSIGLTITKRDQKIDHIRSLILDHLNQLLEEEKKKLNDCLRYREWKLVEVNNISCELSLEPFNLPSNRSLLAQNKLLQLKFDELKAMKNERMDQLESIIDKLNCVYRQLGMDDNYHEPIHACHIPTEIDLFNLRSKLMEQEKMLNVRKVQFQSLKDVISRITYELDYTSQDAQEIMLLQCSKESFIFSDANMKALLELRCKLVSRHDVIKQDIDKLKYQLHQLHDRLEICDQERIDFALNLTGTCSTKIRLLQNEIDKYALLKKTNMQKFIKSIRADLVSYFDQCMVMQFDEFLLQSNDYTEELLVRLESELYRMKHFADAYKVVFQKLLDWQDSLKKMLDLEKKSTDPNRFTNRGGALLQIERDRRLLSKKLPRLQKEIVSLINITESKENIPLNLYGLDIDNFFESNMIQLNSSKEDTRKNLSKKSSDNESGLRSSTQKSRTNLQMTKRAISKKNLDQNMKRAQVDIEENMFQVRLVLN